MKSKWVKYGAITVVVLTLAVAFFAISITSLEDPVSTQLRNTLQRYLNNYVEQFTTKAQNGLLTTFDKAVLHTGALAGIVSTWFVYPEGSSVLYHYIYGDGSDLKLSSNYFESSEYLGMVIARLGPGEYGPIGFRQYKDWRLSLALNHYYLSITEKIIRIYHPKIEFAALDSTKVHTDIPLGKMTIRVYDNLVRALNPTPFYVYAEWEVD